MMQPEGRVGKTTSTINLGGVAGRIRPQRCLLVDLDRRVLSAGLGVPHYELAHTVHKPPGEPGVDRRRSSTPAWTVWTWCPATSTCRRPRSSWSTKWVVSSASGPHRGRSSTATTTCSSTASRRWACSPSTRWPASDGVVIPTECEFFSLRGLALLTDTVDKVRDRLNPRLAISGILVTRFDTRTVNAREVMARVLERFGDLVFDTVITRTVRFPRPASPVSPSPRGR